MAEVKLLKTWSSHFALRVVWALKLKGVQFDSIEEDLSPFTSSVQSCSQKDSCACTQRETDLRISRNS